MKNSVFTALILCLVIFVQSCKNDKKSKPQASFEEERFEKTRLLKGQVFEPTEMAILPNLDILIAQRKGEIVFYSHTTKDVREVGKIDVYFKDKVSRTWREEGVLGITADPEYASNSYIYIFYSPIDTPVNRLSRFVFKEGKLFSESEKIILQFYTDRDCCNHTGGSLAFGNDRMLYLSTGDNSNPFDQPGSKYTLSGFASLDNRPGYEIHDSRRSSGNTADYRGKILRIQMNTDGTYKIPEGNLFQKDLAGTKPEIYVMGNRNPYRISVDKKTNFLYWGEVGPDAPQDIPSRGSLGYDELNQARKAGNFGWPFFVGNNFAYHDYDFTNGTDGGAFDALKPINNSKNNTGIKQLPPAMPAFIWYPYGNSKEFPDLGSGSRNAMAGPVFNAEFYPKETRLPDYFNGKLFFYDWARNWIKLITMKPNGDYEKMEPFMPSTTWNSIIDMELGPDGKLYILEYGNGMFLDNPDAGLSRIDYYAGSLPPKATLKIEKSSGKLPMQLSASAELASENVNNPLTYIWHFGNNVITTKDSKAKYNLTTPGSFDIFLEVKDNKGVTYTTQTETINAGNDIPQVKIILEGNPTHYKPGVPVHYKVVVKDIEDGTNIDTTGIVINVDYTKTLDKAWALTKYVGSTQAVGKALMEASDCKACHKTNEMSVAPSFYAISEKYNGDPHTIEMLANKIINGGSGVWGERAMAAHPNIKPADAQSIVKWILSLNSKNSKKYPIEGDIIATEHQTEGGEYLQITATYTDRGAPGSKSQTGASVVTLTSDKLTLWNRIMFQIKKRFK